MGVHLLMMQGPLAQLRRPAGDESLLAERRFVGLDPAGAGLCLCHRGELPAARPMPAGVAAYGCTELSDSGPGTGPAPILMIVAFDVPPALRDEVEYWYSREHIPLLRRAPGWQRARRYEVQWHDGGPRWTSIALHELSDAAVLDSAERAYARATPWRARLSCQAWFTAAGRFLYREAGINEGGAWAD